MAWTLEQQAQEAGGSPLAFPNDVQAGSLLIAVYECGSPFSNAVTDSRGNTWSRTYLQTSNDQNTALCWAISKDAGACTVTKPSDAPSGFDAFRVAEIRAGAGTIALDGTMTPATDTSVGVGTDTAVGNATTVTADGSLGVGVFFTDDGAGGVITAGTGWALVGTSQVTAWAGDYLVLAVGPFDAGTATPKFSNSGNATRGGLLGLTFGFTASGPPPDAGPRLIVAQANRQAF